ncbi:MAG: type VII secretion-associated protein [Pseudonocardia sp.]
MRVAVHAGATAVRLAAVEDGEPYVLAEVPGPATPARVREVLAELLGPETTEADDLVVVRGLVEPGGGRALVAGAREVDAAFAAVCGAGLGRQAPGPAVRPGPWLVLDCGHSGSTTTLVEADGRCTSRRCDAGGARLDEAVAAMLRVPGGPEVPVAVARRARETLSLQPEVSVRPPSGPAVRLGVLEVRAVLRPVLAEVVAQVVAQAGTVAGGRPVPVLLTGGLARTPLLAEMLDAAGIGPVTVARRPDAVAVLGALGTCAGPAPPSGPTARPLRRSGPSGPSCPSGRSGPFGRSGPPSPAGPARAAVAGRRGRAPWGSERRWLPSPPRRRHRGPAAVAAAVTAVVAAALLTAPSGPEIPDGDVVVQYGYSVRMPEGWVHAGGLPERRRTLLAPAAAPDGSDVVTVERTVLGYDAVAEPGRALADLRVAFDGAVAAGAPLADFVASGDYAGRPVATYHQSGPDGPVDWYVLLDVPDQLSVGCRHTPAGVEEVARACATVVGSVRIGERTG